MGVRRIPASVLLALGLLSIPRSARSGIDPGDAGVFFDPAGSWIGRSGIIAYVPFDLYVVSHSVPGGMEGYEFSVIPPPEMLVASARTLPASYSDFGMGADNWIVDTNAQCVGAVGPFVMVKYNAALFLSTPAPNTLICFGGATPSRVSDAKPGYLPCGSSGELLPFGLVYSECAVLNPLTETPAAAMHWGELKARFDR